MQAESPTVADSQPYLIIYAGFVIASPITLRVPFRLKNYKPEIFPTQISSAPSHCSIMRHVYLTKNFKDPRERMGGPQVPNH